MRDLPIQPLSVLMVESISSPSYPDGGLYLNPLGLKLLLIRLYINKFVAAFKFLCLHRLWVRAKASSSLEEDVSCQLRPGVSVQLFNVFIISLHSIIFFLDISKFYLYFLSLLP